MGEITHSAGCYAGQGPNVICTCGAWKQVVAEQLGETPEAEAERRKRIAAEAERFKRFNL